MDQNELIVNEILETGKSSDFDLLSEPDQLSIMRELCYQVKLNDNQLNNVFKVVNNEKTDLERYNLGIEFIITMNSKVKSSSNEEAYTYYGVMLDNDDECFEFLSYFSRMDVARNLGLT